MHSKLVAVAISITNKDSGFAWSFIHQYEKVDIHMWLSRYKDTVTTPTCILFTKDKVFHSFGYESKIKYADLVKEEKHRDWYFFERFLSVLELQEVCMLSFKYIYLADIHAITFPKRRLGTYCFYSVSSSSYYYYSFFLLSSLNLSASVLINLLNI